MPKLTSKTAIITGGASGIGLAIARLFAREGAAVEILDRNTDDMNRAVAEISAAGGTAAAESCDVADAHAVDEVIARIHARRGRIHILINNAGIAHVGNALTTTPEDFERVQRVNVFGPANCLRAALKFMAADGGGCIVNLASTVAVSPLRGAPLKEVSLRSCSRITDLSPLAGSPLNRLDLVATKIFDLTPLANCSTLNSLTPGALPQPLQNTVFHLTPLAKLQLTELCQSHQNDAALRGGRR